MADSNLDENKVIQVSLVGYFEAAQEEKGRVVWQS